MSRGSSAGPLITKRQRAADAAPGAPYFRTLPRFETADPKYSFMNRLLAVGAGKIGADGPLHLIEELL